MKVAIVCPYDWSFPGGVKSHITGLSAALTRAGTDVEIIAPASNPEPGIFVAGRSFGVAANGSTARICFSLSARSRISERLGRGDIDLVHVHEPAIPSLSLLALGVSPVPVVATFHAFAEKSRGYELAAPWFARRLKRLSRRIVVSKACLGFVTKYFPGEYSVIPNGLETSRFSTAEPLPELIGKKPFVLFVGRPEPRKGLNIAVEAMEIVRGSVSVGMVAVGPSVSDVPGWVHAMGPAGPDELTRIFRTADVFVAPSLFGESFGIVLAEAMAAGVPVVCSSLPGYEEASAGAAQLTPAGDPAATALAITRLLSDRNLRAESIQRGLARAAELDWGVLVNDVMDCYRSAV